MTYERTIPPGLEDAIVSVLEAHPYQRDHAMSRCALIFMVSVEMGAKIDERIIREAIHSLRNKGVLICSAPGKKGGYWLSQGWDDVIEFCDRELHSRALDLLRTEKIMREATRRQFGEAVQVPLFETMEARR